MFDTSAYFAQPGVVPLPFASQGLFGYLPGQPHLGGFSPQVGGFLPQPFGILPGQHTQPIWPTVACGVGPSHFAGIVPQGLFNYLPGQYGQPIWPTIGAWPGQGQFAPPLGVGIGPFARVLPLETTWPGHTQFGGAMGRSILPYQLAPQMAYAG